jgi:hypothetical protein
MDTFESRFTQVQEQTGLSIRNVSDLLDASVGSVSHYRNDRNEPSYEKLQTLTLETGVNLHWLITGDGPMFFDDVPAPLDCPNDAHLPRGNTALRTNFSEGECPSGTFLSPAPLTETPSSEGSHAGSSECHGAPATILHDILEHPVWSHPVWPWVGDVIGAISLFGAAWMMLFIARILG